MSNTEKLNLMLVPQTNKNTTTFNTEAMLNENWRKIDQFARGIEEALDGDIEIKLQEVKDQIGNLSNLTTEEKTNLVVAMNEIVTILNAHLADYEQQLGTATLQTTDQTLKGAINEAFQFANNGKNKWATVVGNPLITSDTFAQMEIKTQELKNLLASYLVSKGQTASGVETLQSLINKVASINTGKKWATGTVSLTPTNNLAFLTINNLDFVPSKVIITHGGMVPNSSNNYQTGTIVASSSVDLRAYNVNTTFTRRTIGRHYSSTANGGSYDREYFFSPDSIMLSNGFSTSIPGASNLPLPVSWWAFE